ncbi:hypothetical protein ACFFIG_00875 [Paraburkholderia rhizosphaerae]
MTPAMTPGIAFVQVSAKYSLERTTMAVSPHKSGSRRKVKSRPRSSRVIAAVPKKKIRFGILRTPNGDINVVGRPEWTTQAKELEVNQDENLTVNGVLVPVEDRRHLLHWDEDLRPILNSVFTAMEKEFTRPGELLSELKAPLAARRYVTTAKTVDDYMRFVARKINGSPDNLVPDRADINQAIEKVRANLRKYENALHDVLTDADIPAYGADGKPNPSPQAAGRIGVYRNAARKYLNFDPHLSGATPIQTKINEIQGKILEMLDGCDVPHEVWHLLNELKYSVTFDLSAKATRDKTAKSLAWQNMMRRNTETPARDRYRDLLSFLD